MTTYRAGQRVRIEWNDGDVLEGTVREDIDGQLVVRGWFVGEQAGPAYERTITVLSEPRPDEPTGLGAVVEASAEGMVRTFWIRARKEPARWRPWEESRVPTWGPYRNWDRLIDPVVLSEGWKP